MSFRSLDDLLIRLTSWAVVYLTAQMTVVVLIGVFARYVLNDALAWIEELARYSMVWLSWIGGGLALRKGAHLAAEFVVDALPDAARRAILLVGRLAVLFFLAICLWYSVILTERVSMQSTIALGVSMQLPYAAMPIGSALMIYHLLVLMICPWAQMPTQRTEVQV